MAVVMVAFAAPLYFDLAVAILGNLRRARRTPGSAVRSIQLAAVVPAHEEEAMIEKIKKALEL